MIRFKNFQPTRSTSLLHSSPRQKKLTLCGPRFIAILLRGEIQRRLNFRMTQEFKTRFGHRCLGPCLNIP
jgi:hypothetical protein